MKTLAIIIHYNSPGTFKLVKTLSESGIKTIVVNNEDQDLITKVKFPNPPEIINNHSNIGFSSAANIGIKRALGLNASIIILINPDIGLSKKNLAKMLNCKYDIYAPVIKYSHNGVKVMDYGGKVNKVTGRATHLIYKNRQRILPSIDYVSGAFMVINTKIFKSKLLLNEEYFLYYEDTEFCIKAKKLGYLIGVCGDFTVKHGLSQSVGINHWNKHYHNLKSNVIFIKNNIEPLYKPIAYGYWSLLVAWTTMKYILSMFIVK